MRQSQDRIAEYDRQIAEVQSHRTPPPTPPDYAQVDTRQLRTQLMAEHRTPTEILGAMRQAESDNTVKRQALLDLHAEARRAFPGNSQKQKNYVEKRLAQERAAYDREFAAWQKQDAALTRSQDKLTSERNTEAIRAKEDAYRGAQRQMKEDFATEQRSQRQQEADLRRQVEADKAEARRQAKAQKQPADAATAYRQEINRRRTYWQAAARGDWEQAKRIYPDADHEQNRRDLEQLAPPSRSKANLKTYEAALKQLQFEQP